MAFIKKEFSIKDLEVLSGVKAHTLRIWEKRYAVLNPDRTDTNIRTYGLEQLQKVLNIAFLNENGYKISRIAKMNEKEVLELVNQISSKNHQEEKAIKSLKLAMYNFDNNLFYKTYDSLLETKTFREIFCEVFIPFLQMVGTLWQTNSIHPVHEHFISNLIKQKLLMNIDKFQQQNTTKNDVYYVLFLPENEIHDLGILYANYEILLHGYQALYLGHSLPIKDLFFVKNIHKNIRFISYLTIIPEDLQQHLNQMNEKILSQVESEYWILGKSANYVKDLEIPEKISFVDSLENFVTKL